MVKQCVLPKQIKNVKWLLHRCTCKHRYKQTHTHTQRHSSFDLRSLELDWFWKILWPFLFYGYLLRAFVSAFLWNWKYQKWSLRRVNMHMCVLHSFDSRSVPSLAILQIFAHAHTLRIIFENSMHLRRVCNDTSGKFIWKFVETNGK